MPSISTLPLNIPVVPEIVPPVTLPVRLPVTFPSKLAIKVACAYPVPLVFTVVVGSVSNPLNNLYLPVRASLNSPEYSVVPEGVYLP